MTDSMISRVKAAVRRSRVTRLVDPYGKAEFVKKCPAGARLLDVGCGSNSPYQIKTTRPDLHYIGIDVGDYRQSQEGIALADEYLLVSPEDFAAAIANIGAKGKLDAIISAHNIEHCLEPDKVLAAMIGALKPGGYLFISFPSEASAIFPHRENTLNFFDDPTHREIPNFQVILDRIKNDGMTVSVLHRRYRPTLYYILGMLMEPISALRKRIMRGTWAFWGFESVIWAEKVG